jgi:hypothetical protein
MEAKMYKVYEIDASEGWFCIQDEAGCVIHEGTFDNEDEAQLFANAYNNGAQSFEDAHVVVHGVEA